MEIDDMEFEIEDDQRLWHHFIIINYLDSIVKYIFIHTKKQRF